MAASMVWILQISIISLIIGSLNCIGIGYIGERYNWKCNRRLGFCVRQHVDIPITSNDTILYKSQEICHLICGPYGSLWPKPTGRTILEKDLVIFNPNSIRFSLDKGTTDTKRYFNQISDIFVSNVVKTCKNCNFLSHTEFSVRAFIVDNDIDIKWTTDESYSLDISTTNGGRIGNFIKDATVQVEINAHSIFGVRHALETLSQLITMTTELSESLGTVAVLVATAHITDQPVYPHRGLMIDTSRNFIPVKDLERSLDGMGSSKLNIFHWHATDSHSFPLDLPRSPQMARYGAYSSEHVYSKTDIEHIISYAKLRGVRVIIEIDAPSHSGNGWQWGPEFELGDLAVCVNQQPWRNYCVQPPCGQLNPSNPNVYKVLQNIYKDLKELLPPGETIHMGGDEVHLGCWNSSNEIVDFMNRQGMGRNVPDFLQLWGDFQATSLGLWDTAQPTAPTASNTFVREFRETPVASNSVSRRIILWSSQLTDIDNIESYLQKERYIIQTWVASTSDLPKKLIEKGYSLIMSTKNAWYFDHGFWGNTPYYTWRVAYNNRIPKNTGVLGGEACVWSELIDTNTLDGRTWPRAAAVAERLWTDPESNAISAEARFYRHRARLIQKGLAAETVAPEWCVQNEGECV